MVSPRWKYLVLDDERAAEVPMPYRLFSQTKTQGRFQTACAQSVKSASSLRSSPDERERTRRRTLGHVVRLEDLALVRRAVAVHGERGVLVVLAEVLLRESDAGAERHLRADDTVAAEEAASGSEGGSVRL